MKKKIQYIENNQTRLLSKICKDAGYSKCLCHIWRHFLYFNDPATPEDYGIWFSLMARTVGKRHVVLWIHGMTRYTEDCANAFQMELKDLRFMTLKEFQERIFN